MSNRSIVVIGWCVVLATSSAFAVDRETYVKRVGDTEGMKVALAEWAPALKSTTSEQVNTFGLFDLLGKLDPLWNKDHKLQQDVSKKFLARMKALNPEKLAVWQAAFKKGSGDEPTKTNTLLLIIQQDRLFDKTELKEKEAERFLVRLQSLSEKSVKEWAELIKESKAVAATYLLNQDALFKDDAFQQSAFQKLFDETKSNLDRRKEP